MNKILQIATLFTLLCVCGFCVVASTFYIRVGGVLEQLQSSDVAAHLNATLDAVSRPCVQGKSCGTLADVAKTLATVRGAAGQIEVAANHEDKRIAVIDAQEAQIYEDAHGALGQLRVDLQTANTSIAGVQPVLDGLTRETEALRLTTTSANALIANEQIPVILNNTAAATGHVSQAAGNLDATTKDVREAVHSALHPTVVHRVLNVVTDAAHIAFSIVF